MLKAGDKHVKMCIRFSFVCKYYAHCVIWNIWHVRIPADARLERFVNKCGQEPPACTEGVSLTDVAYDHPQTFSCCLAANVWLSCLLAANCVKQNWMQDSVKSTDSRKPQCVVAFKRVFFPFSLPSIVGEVCVCVCALTASQVKWVYVVIPLGYTGTKYGFSRTT